MRLWRSWQHFWVNLLVFLVHLKWRHWYFSVIVFALHSFFFRTSLRKKIKGLEFMWWPKLLFTGLGTGLWPMYKLKQEAQAQTTCKTKNKAKSQKTKSALEYLKLKRHLCYSQFLPGTLNVPFPQGWWEMSGYSLRFCLNTLKEKRANFKQSLPVCHRFPFAENSKRTRFSCTSVGVAHIFLES